MEQKFWWCNQNTYKEEELEKKVIAASQANHSGRTNTKDINPGDITVHYNSRNQEIFAFSKALQAYVETTTRDVGLSERDPDDSDKLWVVGVEYFKIDRPISFRPGSQIRKELCEIAPEPFRAEEDPNSLKMAYVLHFSKDGLTYLLKKYDGILRDWLQVFVLATP